MRSIEINIVKEFSKTPGARSRNAGKFSAEEFYETVLKPKFQEVIQTGSKLVINLDGTAGLAASFLDQAFAQLLTQEFGKELVLSRIVLISEEMPEYIEEITSYIKTIQKD